MMNYGMFMLMVGTFTLAEPMDDLKRDTKALEIFLQDKEDKKTHCPNIKWVQPNISVYKDTLESQLPSECKK
jgi:hypothetical protein